MIAEFKDEYKWLSNFYPCEINISGQIFPSVEHAYMSMKSEEAAWKSFCANEKNPGIVKKESRKVRLTPFWDDLKLDIMEALLVQKFSQEPFKSKLLATGQQELQEGNWWGDRYWGVCLKTSVGENNLGKLIMEIRRKLWE